MDAQERVTELSAEELRVEIVRTGEDLGEDFARLWDVAQAGIRTASNPFHIKEHYEKHPLLICGLATGLGFLVARTRLYRAPVRVVGGVGRTVGRVCGDIALSSCIRAAKNLLSR